MWCYQKPGFESLLLAELQRQQQCSQFCDTLLNTDGVSVPAHSCILSAISPQMSSALSSAPPPPAGRSRLLEFQALGACSLLHVVRLLYCGEMAGEGEKERQEAISAAAKLGIHGLVEVTKRDPEGRNKEDWRTEVGVQTEPPSPQEKEGSLGRWRSRELTDGSTLLWKEMLSDGKKEAWTQTEQLLVNADPPPQPVSFETIDMTALQSLGETDSHPAPPQISYIPISLIYPPDKNQIYQPSSDFMQEFTSAGHTVGAVPHTHGPPHLLPFSSHMTPCAADHQSWRAGPQGAAREVTAVEEFGDEPLEQFEGNIPGYISYFLNPDKMEGFGRGNARSRRGEAVGGARTSGRRANRPQAIRGKGSRGLKQAVDFKKVGVSKLQKLFLQRLGSTRAGQGGGAVGRKLYLKTRELLKSTKSGERRRGRGKVCEFSQSGDVLPGSKGGNAQRRKNAAQQLIQDDLPVGKAQRALAKQTASVSFPSPHKRLYNGLTVSSGPPPAPPPDEQQPEHFDRLLEEVMIGLDILPNSAPHSQPPLSTGGSSHAPCCDTLVQNKPCDRTTGLREASPRSQGSTLVNAKPREDVGSNSELFILQQQGEINEMLDQFLQSFEQPGDGCSVREEAEVGGWSGTEASQPYTGLSEYRKNKTNRRSRITEPQQSGAVVKLPRCSQPRKTFAPCATPPKNTEESPTKQRKRRRKNEYLFPLEKKQVRVRKPMSPSEEKTKDVHGDRGDEQLKLRPVVHLWRCVHWPAEVTLQQCSFWEAKDSLPFLEEPLQIERPLAEGRPSSSRDELNTNVHSLSPAESSAQPIQPCGTEEQRERRQERHEEAEGASKRGGKRRAVSEVMSDEAKRICFEQAARSMSATCVPSPPSTDSVSEPATREINVLLTSIRDCLQIEDGEKGTMWSEPELRQTEGSLMDEETEIIDVDGDLKDDRRPSRAAYTLSHLVVGTSSASPSSCSEKEVCVQSTGSWEEDKDEDIDVIGAFSPVPEPVIISWTESSEEDGEVIDVVGEKMDYSLSVGCATNIRYNTEVL